MPIITDPAFDKGVLPGSIRRDLFASTPEAEEPATLMDALRAANIESNIGGAFLNRINEPRISPATPDKPKEYFIQRSQQHLKDDGVNVDFDPYDYATGYEDNADEIGRARNPAELLTIMQRIDDSRERQDVLRRAGWVGTAADITMNILDPTLVLALVQPELGIAKITRLKKLLAAGALAGGTEATHEAALQALSETRTAQQSLFNIGGATLIGGVLGSLGRIPKTELNAVEREINKELSQSLERSAGSAAVRKETTLERESLTRGGQAASDINNALPLLATDFNKIMATDLVTAKETLQDLVDVPAMLGKNLGGERTLESIENRLARHDARVADYSDYQNAAWKAYRKRVPKSDRMSRSDFEESIARAARNEDVHPVKEIADSARYLRARVFDPLKDDALKFKLFAGQEGGELGPVVGAKSYFTRMYDRTKILKNRVEWDRALLRHFSQTSEATKAEIQSAIDDVTDKIIHADVGQANFATKVTAKQAGPLKERTLDIPDELIEKFLINDPLKVARAYTRQVAPQVELARRFEGDITLEGPLQRLTDEVNILKQKIADNPNLTDKQKSKEIEALTQQRIEAQDALLRIKQRLTGEAGRLSPTAGEIQRKAVQAARGWRNLVMSSIGGAISMTGGTMDLARIAAHNGFLPTIKKITQLATSKEFRELSKAKARHVGAAVEVALSRRANIANEGAITEGWTQKLAEGIYKYSGLNHVMDFNRMLSASLFEDRVVKAAAKFKEGKLPAFERAELASLGLGDAELKGISKEIAKHGGEVDGIAVSGSATWDDQVLADIYDAAILKESRIAVQTPGVAERVWWMDSEVGKLIGQLKTFALSAPVRMAMAPIQMAGQGQFGKAARFVGFMMIGGYLTHAIRQKLSGRPIETDPWKAAGNAINETGLLGVLPDIASPWARKLAPEYFGKTKFSDRNVMGAYGGPSIGRATDLYDMIFNRTEGGISANDLHALRRMLPFQNIWMFRRAINALEGEAAESMNLTGATNESFVDRLGTTQ